MTTIRPIRYEDVVKVRCMDLINQLRGREGWNVELICDNPDFNPPNNRITVFGEWPGPEDPKQVVWRDQDFDGDSLLECLEKASAAAKV